MKVTFAEAVKSGKRFRYAGPRVGYGHTDDTGHIWRLPAPNIQACTSPGYHDLLMQCAECGIQVRLQAHRPDEWYIEGASIRNLPDWF